MRNIKFRLNFVIAFTLLFFIMRGEGMLAGYDWRPLIPLSMILMALTPYLLFNKSERRVVGLKKPGKSIWLLYGFLLGGAAAFVVFIIGHILFGQSHNNWFVSVSQYYVTTPGLENYSHFQQFLIFTIPALIFSPIGEELFFRGVMQEVLAATWNYKTGMIINSALFGLLHLFHHGFSVVDGAIQFFPVSGIIWCFLIMGTGILFTFIRRKGDSIWAATVTHMAFNLCMNFIIFYIM